MASSSSSSDSQSIVEMRQSEFIVSPSTGKTSLRKAHFLKPTATPSTSPVCSPPPLAPSIFTSDNQELPFKVSFCGWGNPQDKWFEWVHRMGRDHHLTWQRVGILNAIKNSVYKIYRNNDLIFRLTERWCTQTNTFLFKWGETTLTLEDMIIMGGYPVLGDSISHHADDEYAKYIYDELKSARHYINKQKCRKVTQTDWMKLFMKSGSPIEHVAFLVYWLSRFVFPPLANGHVIRSDIFPIAIRLARGAKIALAPAVLASLYTDLSTLKAMFNMVSYKVECQNIRLSSPLQLVQVWAWERFHGLQLQPNMSIRPYEPRFALWSGLKMETDVGDIFHALDGEGFVWRPYTIERCPNFSRDFFKKNEEYWIQIDGVEERLEAIARCMRISKITSFGGNTKMYLPHRVAKQFGIDQDLPGNVTASDSAWSSYTRPVGDVYVPSSRFRAGVTIRYAKWWKRLKLVRSSNMIVGSSSHMEIESVGPSRRRI